MNHFTGQMLAIFATVLGLVMFWLNMLAIIDDATPKQGRIGCMLMLFCCMVWTVAPWAYLIEKS